MLLTPHVEGGMKNSGSDAIDFLSRLGRVVCPVLREAPVNLELLYVIPAEARHFIVSFCVEWVVGKPGCLDVLVKQTILMSLVVRHEHKILAALDVLVQLYVLIEVLSHIVNDVDQSRGYHGEV